MVSSGSKRYSYRPLQNPEIRLVQLHPAQNHDDEIRLTINHERLEPEGTKSNTARLSRRELQKTLPQGWEVFETLEARYLFCYDPDESERDYDDSPGDEGSDDESQGEGESDDESEDGFLTTWDHPDPDFDRALYELPADATLWQRKPAFEALSYTWGPPDNPGTAFIRPTSGNDHVSTLPIGKNLESALRHLRSASECRTLWIDAICINQGDDKEKATQVVRMADIYSRATRVVVWLGPAENDSNLAVATLDYLGAQVVATTDSFRMTAPEAEEPTWYDNDLRLPYSDEEWRAIDALIHRPWFTRVWTAQEIQLANRLAIVQAGSAAMSWSHFRCAIHCLTDKNQHGPKRLDIPLVNGSVISSKDRPLFDLFLRYQVRECSNAHDKVYGMLAMVPPGFAAATRPDYKQPVSKTYMDAFIANTTLLERWDVFGCDVFARSPELDKAPSWVPDLQTRQRRAFSGLTQFAAGNSRLDYQFVDSDKFRVRGIRCATVKARSHCGSSRDAAALHIISLWEPDDLYTASYVTGTSLLEAFAVTILQNEFRDRNPMDEGYPTLEDWMRTCKKHLFNDAEEEHDQFNTSFYLDNMAVSRCTGRVYMETEEGYIGLGPTGSRVGKSSDHIASSPVYSRSSEQDIPNRDTGDIICVFLGCNVPVVLRPLSDGNYRLVGDAYVNGLEDAQSLLGRLPNPWRVQIFDHPDQEFRIEHRYLNQETGELTASDPRLEDHVEWTRVPLEELGRNLTGDDPLVIDFFRHKSSGRMMNSDPRLLPDALEARGVQLQWFTII